MEEIGITSEFIRLDAFLKFCGAVGTGGEAKIRIAAGEARVNGAVCTQRGKKLRAGDSVSFGGLLGQAPVMKISTVSPARFIARGGRIPAPIHSLKN